MDPRIKQLKIKSGVLKRAVKEKEVYQKEVEREKQRFNEMKNKGKDEYELRKQEEVINESLMMIPDGQKRISFAYNDLKLLLQESEADLGESEEFLAAKEILSQVNI